MHTKKMEFIQKKGENSANVKVAKIKRKEFTFGGNHTKKVYKGPNILI